VPSQFKSNFKLTTQFTENTGSHAQKVEKTRAQMTELQQQFDNIEEEEQSDHRSFRVPDETVRA
jgi:hypothetical protein